MIPTFTCPKCGAVADVTFRAGATQEDLDAAHKAAADAVSLEWAFTRRMEVDRLMEDLERGDRLEASCPRCTHRWQEKPLDVDPTGPIPIYHGTLDGLARRVAEQVAEQMRRLA